MVAPFRIGTARRRARIAAPGGEQADEPLAAYAERLHKLIPAEVLTLYLAGTGVLDPDPRKQPSLWIGWTLFCGVAVVATRAWGTRDSSAAPTVQWKAVAIAVVSFVIWVYQIGGVFTLREGLHDAHLATLFMLGWTFSVPYFYRGDDT